MNRKKGAKKSYMVGLHDKFMEYVNNRFMNYSLFHKIDQYSIISCVTGCSSEEAVEESMDKVVRLLAYFSDKDLFTEFHGKALARRILFDKSVNDDHQRRFLSQLKQQCGGQFTSKMEGMESPSIDLTATTVLTTGFWPSYKSFALNLSAEMIPPSPVDEKNMIEDVDKDRRYAVDASISRIMKSRKVLGSQQLVMECVEQLSRMFKADFSVIIKKRIEYLFTWDYLERYGPCVDF